VVRRVCITNVANEELFRSGGGGGAVEPKTYMWLNMVPVGIQDLFYFYIQTVRWVSVVTVRCKTSIIVSSVAVQYLWLG
jgi:hypothetical protein